MSRGRRSPLLLSAAGPVRFPDPRLADRQGLLAVGGDLEPQRLLAAYRAGIFPWYDAGLPILWWSPDPRAIVEEAALHVPRRLARRARRGDLALSWNRCFGAVVRGCAAGRADGTWLVPEMIAAYERLHRLGHAHSLEVWRGELLVGGVYGVQCGGLFAAESMFHRVDDASKLALVALVRAVFAAGVRLLDVQLVTPHLARLGAVEIPRASYLERLARARGLSVDLTRLQPRLPLD